MNKTLESVLKECFWEDYNISLDEAEELLEKKNKEFTDFLIMRIIQNSPSPSSRLKSLFSPDYIKDFIYNIKIESPYLLKRIKLIRSVLYRDPIEGYLPWKIN
jgi:hypothetical protein